MGYRRALKKHGLTLREDWTAPAGHDDQAGYAAMQRLLARKPHPHGVFCFNDPVAVGAMRAILEAGLAIPSDIALIGAANMHFPDLLVIPLSTVDQGSARIGALAAQRLLTCMNAPRRLAPEAVLVPARLIVRASSHRLTPASNAVLYR